LAQVLLQSQTIVWSVSLILLSQFRVRREREDTDCTHPKTQLARKDSYYCYCHHCHTGDEANLLNSEILGFPSLLLILRHHNTTANGLKSNTHLLIPISLHSSPLNLHPSFHTHKTSSQPAQSTFRSNRQRSLTMQRKAVINNVEILIVPLSWARALLGQLCKSLPSV
jgi:hypothetical protein